MQPKGFSRVFSRITVQKHQFFGAQPSSQSDELWNEVRDIVQETGIKTIPKETKCKEAKWLSEEALQIAVKRREAKRKGEKERKTI